MWRSVAESFHERVPTPEPGPSLVPPKSIRDGNQENFNNRRSSRRSASLIEPSAMSPTLSHSRLFKATRRFIVAEVTLIVVIVILFAWSTYVLFRLFAGNNDTLFGFSVGSQPHSIKPQQQVLENQANSTIQPNQSPALSSLPIAGQSPAFAPALHQHQFVHHTGELPNLNDQLANYKNQILKELIARQQRLLSADASGRAASLLAGRQLNQRSIVDEPGNSVGRDRSRIIEHDDNRRGSPPIENSLIYLENAPSLMQLSSKSASYGEPLEDDSQTTTTTISPTLPDVAADQSDNLNEQTNPITTTVQPLSAATLESPEASTTQPMADEDHEEPPSTTTTMPGEEDQQSSSGGQDQEDPSDQNNAEDNSNDSERVPNEPAEDERRAMNTVKTIDEEVDRMTQPSLGVASQQARPTDHSSNEVQFDDVLPSDQDENHLERSPPTEIGVEQVAKKLKVEPKSEKQAKVRQTSTSRRADKIHLDPGNDLQAADDRHKVPITFTNSSDSSKSDNLASGTSEGRDETQKRMLLKRLRFKRAASDYDFDLADAKKKPKRVSQRRSDDENDEEADDDLEQPSEDPVGQPRLGSQAVASQLNEPTFEELLAHKQLLDALQQSLPPAPLKLENSTLGSMATPSTPIRTLPDSDPQSAGSQYTVDHGLLLYPAADEEHHHKSKSHKSHKASKKKDKKKLTVAMKKGGHKRKKHKKEEKKYHKEKKFKGAKKGKKMKKGKGGKGGKKGKKLFKDKGYKKKGFKNTYVKNEFGSKKSYFDEFRDKDFKKKWKNFDDKYNYAQMKKWQAKDVKKAKKMKDHGEKFKKYDKGKWKKQKFADMSSGSKKSMAKHHKDF